ncbi:MAG: site-specific integrase [Oscillospiraceae bacterium]|nr:site-specific integrase [Oscillospiraceae bacterium]
MYTYHLRKRENLKGHHWQIIVEGDPDPLTGKRNRKYKTVSGTKKEADVEARKMIMELENGGIAKPSALKVADWMLKWLELYTPNIEETTRCGYKEGINSRLIPELGSIPLKSLSTSHIQSWVNRLSSRLAPKTVKNVFLNLKQALDKAYVLRMIPYNPCTGVELPKLVKPKHEIYDSNEISIALDAAKGTDMYLILLLALSVGLRRGELLALRWEDINFKKKTISVVENRVLAGGEEITKAPKSKAGLRTITIGNKVLSELKKAQIQYLEKKETMGNRFFDSGLVICKEDGKGYYPDAITRKWSRFVKQKNLKKIRFHDLRHSCATAMIEAGIDPKTVQQRMGHADISVTMNIYAHCTKTMDTRAAEAMDKMIFAKAI